MADRERAKRPPGPRVKVAQVRSLEDQDPRDEVLPDLSPAARVELVAELSARMWELTGRPLPDYSRSEMPVRVVPRE